MSTTLSSVPVPGAKPPTPAEARAYISDMLGQLADLARASGDRRLEGSMRILAVEAASAAGASCALDPD